MISIFNTDEDKLIYKLTIHKNLITKLVHLLTINGISCDRTRNNDPNGDILILHDKDKIKAIEIIEQFKKELSG